METHGAPTILLYCYKLWLGTQMFVKIFFPLIIRIKYFIIALARYLSS